MEAEQRATLRQRWLQQVLGDNVEIRPLAGDASFRCYFRVQYGSLHYVLMDAPPEHEDVTPFLAVRRWFERVGLRVSDLTAENKSLGFLLLEDFGDQSWASYRAAGGDMTSLFEDALRQLHLLQGSQAMMDLPVFDVSRMQSECDLYLDWYLPKLTGNSCSPSERLAFHGALLPLLQQLESLPRVPVHLDYHSRNLMLPESGLPLGQIDYQDAVMGPVTYDLASLLYDCYQDYPEHQRQHWSYQFFNSLPAEHAACFNDEQHWHRCLRLTALQRHIKAIGIFARLAFRDGKVQFLDEIPLSRKHLHDEMIALNITVNDIPLLFIEAPRS